MKSLIITLIVVFILSFIYIDKFTLDKGEEINTAKTSVQSAVELLVVTKVSSKPYSKAELEKELLKDYKPELVESVLNSSNIDFNLQASKLMEKLLLENPEITEIEIEKELLNSGFTLSEAEYATNWLHVFKIIY